jgi:thymidylate kinase
MSLIYITGISGSGKSTVLRELAKQGYEAHGVDEEGYADWIDRKTGAIVPFPHNESPSIHDWYKNHRWVLSEQRIGELKKQADEKDQIVFLSGVAEGEDKVWHLFDKVVALSIDEATIRSRIESRVDNHFGKTPEEMADIIKWLENYDETYGKFGAIVIDATKPIDQVIDNILEAVK